VVNEMDDNGLINLMIAVCLFIQPIGKTYPHPLNHNTMKAEDILKECKDEVARKFDWKDWNDLYKAMKSSNEINEYNDAASILAMSKVAEQSFEAGQDYERPDPGPDKEDFMNNLFPKI
jgi:N-acetyl-anhydromuramyl-L-alanine amidase AmpD